LSTLTDNLPPPFRRQGLSTKSVAIRAAAPSDAAALRDLSAEMLAFYGADRADQEIPSIAEMELFLSGLSSSDGILVAMDGARLVGFAAYCRYPALPLGRHGLFLLDLFVKRTARRSGVGRALLKALCEIAIQTDAVHLDWTADLWNDGSLGFYKAIAEADQVDKVYHRLSRQALDRVATTPLPRKEGS